MQHYEIIKLLVDNGANINVQDIHGFTPLYRAIKRGDINMSAFFVKHKAKTDLLTESNLNALNLAEDPRNVAIIELLSGKSLLLKPAPNDLISGPITRNELIDPYTVELPPLPATDPFDGPRHPEQEPVQRFSTQENYSYRNEQNYSENRYSNAYNQDSQYHQRQNYRNQPHYNPDAPKYEQKPRNEHYKIDPAKFENKLNYDAQRSDPKSKYGEYTPKTDPNSKYGEYTPNSQKSDKNSSNDQNPKIEPKQNDDQNTDNAHQADQQSINDQDISESSKSEQKHEIDPPARPRSTPNLVKLQVGTQKQVPVPEMHKEKNHNEKPKQNRPKPSDFAQTKQQQPKPSIEKPQKPYKKKEKSTPDFKEYRPKQQKQPEPAKFNIEIKKSESLKLEITKSNSTSDIPKEQENKPVHTFKIEKPKITISAKSVDPPKPAPQQEYKIEKPAFQIIFPEKGKQLLIPSLTVTKKEEKTEFITCPVCKFAGARIIYLVEHLVQNHHMNPQFDAEFVLSKSSKTQTSICATCNNEFPISHIRAHIFSEHTDDVLEFIAKISKNQAISKFCNDYLDKKRNPVKEQQTEEESEKYSDEYDDGLSDVSEAYSDASDNDSDDDEADAYMAFVTSTIDMKGLAVSSKKTNEEEKPVQKIEAEEEKPKKVEEEQVEAAVDSFELLQNLSYVEKYMNIDKMIQTNPVCHCKLCQKDFPYAVTLMKHCMDNHVPKFTPQLLKTLDFMNPGITFEKTDNELLIDQSLHLRLFCYPTLRAPENPRVEFELTFPNFLASLIIEALSVGKEQQIIFPKIFDSQVVMLRLPTPTPFVVTTYEHETVFGIISTPQMSADEIGKTLSSVANYERNLAVLTIRVTNIDIDRMTDDEIYSIAETNGCTVLRSQMIVENNLKSFDTFFFCSSWTEQTKENIKDSFSEIFYYSEVSTCGKCGKMFLTSDAESKCDDGENHTVDNTVSTAEFFEFTVDEISN